MILPESMSSILIFLSQNKYLIVFTLVLIYLLASWIQMLISPLYKIITPPALPFIGHRFLLITRDPRHLWTSWMEFAKEKGLFRYSGLLGPEVAVFSPAFIKQVLLKGAQNFYRSKRLMTLIPIIGNGVFSANGALHSWQRKLMNPLFSYGSIKRYTKAFDSHSMDLVKVWSDKCTKHVNLKSEIEIEKDLSHLTMDIIGDTAFGYSFDSVLQGQSEIAEAIEMALNGRLNRVQILLRGLIPFYDYLPLKVNRDYQRSIKVGDEIIDKIIKAERTREETGIQSNKTEVPDLLTVMVRARDEESNQGMTDDLLRQNVWTILAAGYETTSSALTWALFHLARHKEVQDKARDEILSVLGKEKHLSSEHIEKMEYLSCVVKETLRITPPVSYFLRKSGITQTIGESVILPHLTVSIPVVGIHNYEQYWPEASKFKPERFMDTGNPSSAGISGQTYIPFSSGPRACLGAKFATLEIKVVLARILSNFKISTDDKSPITCKNRSLGIKPHPSPKLKVTKIDVEDFSKD